MKINDVKSVVRPMGIPLIGEGGMMLSCLIPSLHFHDSTAVPILASGLFTILVGILILISIKKDISTTNHRIPFLIVTYVWVILSLFGTLPFLSTGALHHLTDAYFEVMSGFTSTGATVFSDVEHLPASVVLWRSMTQWIGGFGIVLLVLAIVPSLGINKYSLYTAESSGADNTSKSSTTMGATIRYTFGTYVVLTFVFVILLKSTGMHLWEAVNFTFVNISSGGFSVYNDGVKSLTHAQQYIVSAIMYFGGVNFTLIYHFLTLQFSRIRGKLDQIGFYTFMTVVSIGLVAVALHLKMGYDWSDAVRLSTVQTTSAISTTGSVIDDFTQWWTPIQFLLLLLTLCGGMAGSTVGGLKSMRVLILLRNVRTILRNRLHPNAVNPVRLNGKPVSSQMINNVMVILFIYLFVIILGVLCLMLCHINATEALGATIACITGCGPGLGACGGFGNYMYFSDPAKWICVLLMLLGRLECLTVIILLLPRFWRR